MNPSILQRSKTTRRPADARRGFALLITITLLAFLVLLLVSLATLTRVETQVAGNNRQLAQARQNALLALNIALGQLQKSSGPDQRVTASADIRIPSAISIPANATGAIARSTVDTYWNASRNRHWTGVWKNTTTTAYDVENPATANATPSAEPVWLVSGNEKTDEGTAATYLPTDTITGVTITTSAADDTIKDSAGRPHRLLVGKNDTAPKTSSDRHLLVTAPQVTLYSKDVAGQPAGDTAVGHYAWWIGDEGIKARANLVDQDPTDSTAATNRKRLQAARRPAIEAMTTNDASAPSGDATADGLKPYYPVPSSIADTLRFTKLFNNNQLEFLNTSTVFREQLRQRFHDLTTTSRGVLSDTKNGGLKRDLSYLLALPTLGDFRTALKAAYDGANVLPDATYNPALSPVTTAYANTPSTLTGFPSQDPTPASVSTLTYSATWEQLWSYYNMGKPTPQGVFNSSGEAVPRTHNGTQEGLYPLLVQSKLFYRLTIDATGNIVVEMIPVIVLANPYNVALAAQTYRAGFGGGANSVRLYIGAPADPNNPLAAEFTAAPGVSITNLVNSFTGDTRLLVNAPRMEPGVAMVFTLKDPVSQIPTVAAQQKLTSFEMIPGFFPTHALTYNTNKKIVAPATHAALLPANGLGITYLFSNDYTDALGQRTLLRSFEPHIYQEDSDPNLFLVNPTNIGTKQGGGINSFVNDASFSDADTDGDPLTKRYDQQTVFYQVNYRALTVANAAATSYLPTTKDIARAWARGRIKGGNSAGSATFNPFIASNLVFKDSAAIEVRWGLFNIGAGTEGDLPRPSLSGNAGLVNFFYDIPRADNPVTSLGQLQHFNSSGHIPLLTYGTGGTRNAYSIKSFSFQNNYPISNSYPNLLLTRERVMDVDAGMGYQFDGSYLWNDALWDRFFFSSYPTGAFDFATDKLINSRYQPFRDRSLVPWHDSTKFRGDATVTNAANSRKAAENLLVEGAFNINSTSVDAWKSFFSSLKNTPVGNETATANLSAPFARTLYQNGGFANAQQGNTVNAWTGTFNLTPAQINTLAEEMVLQVRRRGPFLSLADFVNRRLIKKADDTYSLGLSGALQSAIDKVVNQTTDVDSTLRTKSDGNIGRPGDKSFIMPTGISGFSGYLLQADVLSALGSSISARSDTFIIRTYGDVLNPGTSEVQGRAWCEAVVQRVPDYVIPKNGAAGNSPDESATDADNVRFGRRYQLVSFRWLNANEI